MTPSTRRMHGGLLLSFVVSCSAFAPPGAGLASPRGLWRRISPKVVQHGGQRGALLPVMQASRGGGALFGMWADGDDSGGVKSTDDWEFQLHLLCVEARMRDAVSKERYKEAAELRNQKRRLMQKASDLMAGSLGKAAVQLRERLRREGRDKEEELLEAIAREDYSTAHALQAEIEKERQTRNWHCGPAAGLAHRFETTWMMSEIKKKVAEERERESKKGELPRLLEDLQRAVEGEEYDTAAQVRDMISAEQLTKDKASLWRFVARDLKRAREERDRMKKTKKGHFMALLLEEAVLAEDFEAAGLLLQELRSLELNEMNCSLTTQLKKAHAKEAAASKKHMTDHQLLERCIKEAVDDENYELAAQLKKKDGEALSWKMREISRMQEDLDQAIAEERFQDARLMKYRVVRLLASQLSPVILIDLGVPLQTQKAQKLGAAGSEVTDLTMSFPRTLEEEEEETGPAPQAPSIYTAPERPQLAPIKFMQALILRILCGMILKLAC